MFGLLFVVAVGIFTLWYTQSPNEATRDLPQRLSAKLDKLWEIAQESLKSQRYLRAEKALLTILRIDERNATATTGSVFYTPSSKRTAMRLNALKSRRA